MKFHSRSKQEYNELLKKPIYTSTTVRIKLNDNLLLQFQMSPKETV